MKVNFALMQHHKYSLSEIEEMLPWEREVYLNMLMQHIEDENMRMRHEAANRKFKG
jgi:hypothetical protein